LKCAEQANYQFGLAGQLPVSPVEHHAHGICCGYELRSLSSRASLGFDFGGVYDVVNRHKAIGYTMEDGRRVDIAFVDQGMRRRSLKRSTRKAPIPSSSSKQAGKRSWTISKPIPNKTNHREEDAGEDARRLSF